MIRSLLAIRYLPGAAIALLSLVPPALAQQPRPAYTGGVLTVRDIFRGDGLTGQAPDDLAWSPDGKYLTYLSAENDLVSVNAASGQSTVLVGHDKLAGMISENISEKDKDHRDRYGQPSYQWSPDSRHLLFDSGGRIWIYDLKTGTGVQIASTGMGSGDDPKFSPDGAYVSFIREHNLCFMRLRASGSPETLVTSPRNGDLLNGEVDWIYLEELDARSNYFWSPDSRKIAYLQTNESVVPMYPIADWLPVHATIDRQHYPQPGDTNPAVHLGVVSAKGGKTQWFRLPVEEGEDYIPRFGWATRKTLWVETLSRDHRHLNLYFADTDTGAVTLALAQTEEKFFDESYDVTFAGPRILLTSWRDGHNHIYLYSFDESHPGQARLERQLTSGNFEVEAIKGLDASGKRVFYLSNEGDPRQQQVWSVELDGSGKRRLTATPGFHEADVAPAGDYFTNKASSRMTPPVLNLCSTSNGACKSLWKSKPLPASMLTAPEPLELKAADGTVLYGELLLPQGNAPSVPLIVNPYGGPHAQTVRDRWGGTAFLFDQLLTQHGYAVLHVDNRGMGGRGRAFAQTAYRNFGAMQFDDQMRAIDQVLARYPQLDANRLGWWGWSWGGTFTLYALTHSPRFLAGVSVAPVTDFRLYDSIYTERYLGTPSGDPEGYRDASPVNTAAQLKGHLLLVQGTGDDNVHMGNTIQFLQKLIEAGLPYDLQLYPRKTHSIAGSAAKTHLYSRILAHFDEYLMRPPQDGDHATDTGTKDNVTNTGTN